MSHSSESLRQCESPSTDGRSSIRHPISKDNAPRPSVLLQIPPGPALCSKSRPEESQVNATNSLLEQFPQSTVVTIDYRISSPLPYTASLQPEYRYPQPIHDVCVAFAYLTSTILPDLFPQRSERRRLPNIYITGSHIGGALATTLALTEASKISGVSVSDPLIDWCMFDEHAGLGSATASKSKKTPTTDPGAMKEAAKIFLAARTRLFSTPSAYFDPFASPLLFLRAPGRDTPRTHVEALGLLDSSEELNLVHDDSALEEEESISIRPSPPQAYGPYDDDLSTTTAPSANQTDGIPAQPQVNQPTKRYKVLRRWPPNGRPEDVFLPRFHIQSTLPTGAQDGYRWLLHKQATELADYLRRACFWGRERSVGEERVQLNELPFEEKTSVQHDRTVLSLQQMIQADLAENQG